MLRRWPAQASAIKSGERLPRLQLIDRSALRRHIEQDLPVVTEIIVESMQIRGSAGGSIAEAACRCAESWVNYGLAAE